MNIFAVTIILFYYMTLQQLEYIMAVARHGHFGRAADACNVTQPTLSAMIGKLEEEIGAKLFDRNRQPICPTQVGERVINRAREILEELESQAPAAPVQTVPAEDDQVSMLDLRSAQVCQALEKLSVETLTPIEAMNELYKLKKMLD